MAKKVRNNILKTINLHEQFNFKSKNLITYLVEVEYWKVKEKNTKLPSPGPQKENADARDQRNQEENARESRKCKKVQRKNKTEASQVFFSFF